MVNLGDVDLISLSVRHSLLHDVTYGHYSWIRPGALVSGVVTCEGRNLPHGVEVCGGVIAFAYQHILLLGIVHLTKATSRRAEGY